MAARSCRAPWNHRAVTRPMTEGTLLVSYYLIRTSYYCLAPPHPAEIRGAGFPSVRGSDHRRYGTLIERVVGRVPRLALTGGIPHQYAALSVLNAIVSRNVMPFDP